MNSTHHNFLRRTGFDLLTEFDLPTYRKSLTVLIKSKIVRRALACALVLILQTILSGSVAAQNTKQDTADERAANAIQTPPVATQFASAYRVGERLTYTVSFANFPTAAHVEMYVAGRSEIGGRSAIELQAHVETLGVVNAALFAINNDYRSFVDAGTGLPFRTSEIKRDGAQAGAAARDYNQPLGTDAVPSRSRRITVGGNYDFLSALYRVRALPLEQGNTYRLNIESNNSQVTGNFEIDVRVTGRAQIRTNIGTFNTIVVEARPRKSNRYTPRVFINFSDDERHVPVKITLTLPQGEAEAMLASSEFPATAPPPSLINPPASSGQIAATSSTPSTPAVLDELPFKAGEQLNYNLFLGNAPTGTISLQVRPRAEYFGRDGLMFAASTNNLAANLTASIPPLGFSNLASYTDPQTLTPFRTELRRDAAAATATATAAAAAAASPLITDINQTRGLAVTSDGANTEVPLGTHDLLSIVYALRTYRLNSPKPVTVSLLYQNQLYKLTARFLTRDLISIANQSLPARQLSLTTNDASPDQYQMRLWISDDARRLPLRFTAQTAVGMPLRADLAILPIVAQ